MAGWNAENELGAACGISLLLAGVVAMLWFIKIKERGQRLSEERILNILRRDEPPQEPDEEL